MIPCTRIVSIIFMKTTFLKDCIADAYIQLILIKDPSKITADEITKQAGVGRATYFRNFSSKQEILIYKLERDWDNFAQTSIENDKVSQNILEFFEFNYKYKDLIKRIYEIHQQEALLRTFFRILNQYPSFNPYDEYLTRYISYGLFGLLEEWVKRDFRESPQDLAEFVNNHIL